MAVSSPGGPIAAADSSVERESDGMVQSSSIPIESPGKKRSFRHNLSKGTSDPCATTSDDQVVLNKRPMP